MRVHIRPEASDIEDHHGIGRVVHAQYKYLPAHEIELVGKGERADVYAGHTQRFNLPRLDVLHCHGAYWTAEKHGHYTGWHHGVNFKIVEAAREAIAVTVPSEWVAMPFKRDMRISPTVIGHGIEFSEWTRGRAGKSGDYVLWNKNRHGDVCDPTPPTELAKRGVKVVSTFATSGEPASMKVTGRLPAREMKELIRNAFVYLATAQETFGIGTLEAMACGVPVLGYDWAGTAAIVTHKKDGYLVKPGDIDGLLAGLEWLASGRIEIGEAARETARRYDWKNVIGQYADLYREVSDGIEKEQTGVSIVITNHNYAEFIGEAIESALSQTRPPKEIIIVDDGSTDDSLAVIARYARHASVKIVTQPNQGVAAARSAGIRASSQEYIICLDADDKIEPRFVEILHAAMLQDRTLGVAYTGLSVNGRPNPWPPEFSWESQSVASNPPSNCVPSACMFRREMWLRAGPHKQEYAPGEDAEFWTRGLSVGFKAKRITPEPLFWYRAHPDSASRRLRFTQIDAQLPWMRDGLFPLAAPLANSIPPIRSYSAPLVSVIIPVGTGHADYLPDALDSLLGQTFREWEAVVVDDTGKPSALDAQTMRRYSFVVLCATKGKKRGSSHARNLGIKHARAPLVLFLDADDTLAPDALTEMVKAYVASGGRYVYTDYYLIGADGKAKSFPSGEWRQDVWRMAEEPSKRGLHGVTALVPREWIEAVGGFDAEVPGFEEGDLYTRLAIAGYCGARLPKPLLMYRGFSGNGRKDSLANLDETISVIREKYGDYLSGEKEMAPCCGGNGETIMRAKEAIGEARPAPQVKPVYGTVRMEYVGDKVGAITFFGMSAERKYRGGNNPQDKYANVHPEDVERLKSTGAWRPAAVIPISAAHVMPDKEADQWRQPAPEKVIA
jgi:glycosyltransferase involved in cell wall biosynthesis